MFTDNNRAFIGMLNCGKIIAVASNSTISNFYDFGDNKLMVLYKGFQ